MRSPGHEKRYQVYFRDPITRKFVPIQHLVVDTDVVSDRGFKESHHVPKLRRGIPSMSYRGNPIWQK